MKEICASASVGLSLLKHRPTVKVSRRWLLLGFSLLKLAVLLVLFAALPARSEQTVQFWPEVDTYFKLDPKFRLSFIATTSQEAGSTVGSEFGANLDIFVRPLFKLKRFTVFQLDESKSRLLTFTAGYHYLPSPDGSNESRVLVEATPRFPLKAGVLVSDRNRVDLRWISGDFSWRYRNRLTAERTFAIRSYHLSPYLQAEAYYDSSPEKWSRTTEDIGCIFPIRRRAEIEPYYQHMNDTSKSPNRQTHGIGLHLRLYF
jgi:Protein of unknown function (DUF2490)